MTYDCAIIGGGIVGLATTMTLLRDFPSLRVVLLEKETALAQHQTGRNSGVIHSGIYYAPGSLKARLAREGNAMLREFCAEHDVPFEICGKLIVATCESELTQLEKLAQRATANGLAVRRLTREQAREIEPHVECCAAIHLASTGIVSYRAVASEMAAAIYQFGGEIRLGTAVRAVEQRHGEQVVATETGDVSARFVVNCAGLHSDRIARASGCDPRARIVPFRGEYYELVPERRSLVKHLIYPVPNPAFPFLGVHFTRMIDGSVHAGPNAVLALAREGYSWRHRNFADVRETLSYSGFWKLAGRHWAEGCRETVRSLSKRSFVRSLQKLIPEVTERDLVPCAAGVRAQALRPDGSLVDDFLIVREARALHVCNAPSPAATASLAIAREIVAQIPISERTTVACV